MFDPLTSYRFYLTQSTTTSCGTIPCVDLMNLRLPSKQVPPFRATITCSGIPPSNARAPDIGSSGCYPALFGMSGLLTSNPGTECDPAPPHLPRGATTRLLNMGATRSLRPSWGLDITETLKTDELNPWLKLSLRCSVLLHHRNTELLLVPLQDIARNGQLLLRITCGYRFIILHWPA